MITKLGGVKVVQFGPIIIHWIRINDTFKLKILQNVLLISVEDIAKLIID